jgi:AraC-like DNA-binding protein
MTNGRREYYVDGKLFLHMYSSSMIFIPNGFRYCTRVTMDDKSDICTGYNITFDLFDKNGEEIYISDSIKLYTDDMHKHYLELAYQIQNSILCPISNLVRAKANLYKFFDIITTDKDEEEYKAKYFRDIQPAIDRIELYPEINTSISELSKLCNMSESSFRRKFKQYTNGISPVNYRNRIRIMKAEELCDNSSYTIEEAAMKLGFCDAAHLCRLYKQFTGKTLKTR